jgi:hypothetical protein
MTRGPCVRLVVPMGPSRALGKANGWSRALALTLVVPAALTVIVEGAQAQPRGAAPPPRAAAAHKTTSVDAGASPPRAPAPAAAPAAVVPGGDAGVIESRTLDGGTRVFKFTELDIEGRLKSPQLVYFLRRVRAEFAAGDFGHRTFMGEMSETRKEPRF